MSISSKRGNEDAIMESNASKQSENWADMDNEDEIPNKTVSAPDENGVVTITQYKKNGDQLIKITSKEKIEIRKHRMSKAATERQQRWKPFGLAKNPTENITYSHVEDVYIDNGVEKEEDQTIFDERKSVTCRNCGGNHWTSKCPIKSTLKGDKDKKVDGNTNSTAYVPPSKRGGVKEENISSYTMDELPTIKISNLTTEANEDDVRELVRPFGNVRRVRLPVYNETKERRGIAFVSFSKKSEAVDAIKGLDGHGYSHLILQCEEVKPSTGAMSSTFRSGYGKDLIQNRRADMNKN